jgi:hypothetical protein
VGGSQELLSHRDGLVGPAIGHERHRGPACRCRFGANGAPGREPEGGPYVVTTGELQEGARGIAAAVRDVDGLEASVGVVTLHDIDVDRLGPRVVSAAQELGARLR